MQNQSHSTVLFAATIMALGALGACERGRTNEYQMESAAGTVVDEVTWVRDSMLTDASILGALHESNEAEIDASDVAKSRGSDSEVRMFAAQMIADHKRMDERGDSLARAISVSRIDPPDAVEATHDRDIDSLKVIDKDTSTTASAFDRAYIDQQVRAHRQTLDIVDTAIDRAQSAQLKTALQSEVRPAVVGHLQHAEAIQRRLMGSAGRVR